MIKGQYLYLRRCEQRVQRKEQCSTPTEWQGWWTDEPRLYL